MFKPRSPLAAYLAPFAAYMILLILADFLGVSAKYWVFPLQTVVCGGLIIIFWGKYRFSPPVNWGFTLFIAILVLLVWISPQILLAMPGRFDGFNPEVFPVNSPIYYASLGMRFLRLVVVVPFMEEIFWRGFLLRYLVKEDFDKVPVGTFKWSAFVIVTLGFCFEHSRADWAVALVAGVCYNLVAFRTRSLASCVLAHAVTNLGLGLYVMRTGQWGFW